MINKGLDTASDLSAPSSSDTTSDRSEGTSLLCTSSHDDKHARELPRNIPAWFASLLPTAPSNLVHYQHRGCTDVV